MDKYLCDAGSKCISKDLVCNGNKDCRDNSDEIDCPTSSKIITLTGFTAEQVFLKSCA